MTDERFAELKVGDRIEFSSASQIFVGAEIDWTAGIVTTEPVALAGGYWSVGVMADPDVFPSATDRGLRRSARLVRRRPTGRTIPCRRGTSGYSPFTEAGR